MTTISAMLPVTLPRFAPCSSQVQNSAPQSSTQAAQWAEANGDSQIPGDLDFDLLAEYLLEDTTTVGTRTSGMPQFDFR